MATSLPLPKGFFDTANVRLSDEMRRQYIEYAESSIRKVFALSDCHKNSWIPVREKKGVAVYRNFTHARSTTSASAAKSNVAEVGGKADMPATLEEVGRAYAAHDDALFRRLSKKLNPGVLDAAVVLTIVPRTPTTPFRYIGIKWFAVKTPTPLVSHRDYCCLEVQDKIQDSFGNEMFIRILNSIDVAECPSLENSHGLVRAKLLAGFMYRADRAEPNLIRVHHVMRLDPSGYFPSQWAYKTAESQLVHSIVQIKRVIEKQQMNACTFVDRKQWVPNHERLHCAVCSRAFGTFRPRHHCRCCGEVICSKCSIFKSVDVPGTTLKNVRICSICNMGVQRAGGAGSGEAGLDDEEMSDYSASSVTSSSTIAHNEMNMMDLYMSANGTPGTPSAYSNASSQSNLSIRSTASSRSVMDARGRAASVSGTTPSSSFTARFFRGHSTRSALSASHGPLRSTNNLASASGTGRPRSATQTPRSFFNESNTPRSYLANNLTPRSHANQTPRGVSTAPATTTPRNDPQTTSAQEERMSIYKQAPLDLSYLRESVRAPPPPPPLTRAQVTTTGRALSNAELPPAKMARVNDSDDVAMEDVSVAPTHGPTPRTTVNSSSTSSSSASAANAESSTEEPRKTFFGTLFSRGVMQPNASSSTSSATSAVSPPAA